MDYIDELTKQIKILTNKNFYGKITLIFEAGTLVHSEVTQKLKPDALMLNNKTSDIIA